MSNKCNFFAKGHCTKGDVCTDLHIVEQPEPDEPFASQLPAWMSPPARSRYSASGTFQNAASQSFPARPAVSQFGPVRDGMRYRSTSPWETASPATRPAPPAAPRYPYRPQGRRVPGFTGIVNHQPVSLGRGHFSPASPSFPGNSPHNSFANIYPVPEYSTARTFPPYSPPPQHYAYGTPQAHSSWPSLNPCPAERDSYLATGYQGFNPRFPPHNTLNATFGYTMPSPQKDGLRPKMACRYYTKGNCRNGDKCRYSHTSQFEEPHGTQMPGDIKTEGRIAVDDLSREYAGATVQFGDGGQVTNLTLPEDSPVVANPAPDRPSMTFITPTPVYNVLQKSLARRAKKWRTDEVYLRVDHLVDSSGRFTALQIEGDKEKEVDEAIESMEESLGGKVIKGGNKPAWTASLLGNGVPFKGIKEIQSQHGCIVLRDKTNGELRYFGSHTKFDHVEKVVASLVNEAEKETRVIDLGSEDLAWLREKGPQRAIALLGGQAACVDLLSDPKRVVIYGNESRYQAALDVVQKKSNVLENVPALNAASTQCVMCWTEAENPFRSPCNHVYCLECFDYLCTATDFDEPPHAITCQGDVGRCGRIFQAAEIRANLSSSAFETMAFKSFDSYRFRHNDTIHYCPTPDCDYLYRTTPSPSDPVSSAIHQRRCPSCMLPTCTLCHSLHPGITCSDYEAYQMLLQWKRENDLKDCRRCGATMQNPEKRAYVMCPGCEMDVCWGCLVSFPMGGAVLAHLGECDGLVKQTNLIMYLMGR